MIDSHPQIDGRVNHHFVFSDPIFSIYFRMTKTMVYKKARGRSPSDRAAGYMWPAAHPGKVPVDPIRRGQNHRIIKNLWELKHHFWGFIDLYDG